MQGIIILTAKSEGDNIVAGLEIGADDYVTKPFSPNVLIARLHAVLRRNLDSEQQGDPTSTDNIAMHGLNIHLVRHEVSIDGEPVQLTSTEFAILHLLAGKAGWAFTRQQIIDHIRGHDYLIKSRSVDVQIFGLKKKTWTTWSLGRNCPGNWISHKGIISRFPLKQKNSFGIDFHPIYSEHLERLFERFYRTDKARSSANGGTGLGLSIVKHIAVAHGGSIIVKSDPGSGSTFTLIIPQ